MNEITNPFEDVFY